VRGRVRARRGDGDPWPALDEALALAAPTRELQRIGRVAGARAEARWLEGDDDGVLAETEDALALAVAQGDGWIAGELALWRRRAGGDGSAPPAAEPYALELAGDGVAAAARWAEKRCPYDRALALAHASTDAARLEGIEALRRL